MFDRRRRRYLVDRFQARIVLMQWAYLAVFVIAQGFLVFRPLAQKLKTDGVVGAEQAATASLFLELHQTFWPALFLILFIAGVHFVLVSHRLVGPLVRIRSVLGALRDGERPKTVKLRDKDYLTDEAKLLEELSASLRQKEDAAGESWESVQEVVDDLQVAAENERWDLVTPLLRRLEEIAGENAPERSEEDVAATSFAASPTP